MKKEKYERVDLEILIFQYSDVITQSPPVDVSEEDELPFMPEIV